jgi:hypothetical protein
MAEVRFDQQVFLNNPDMAHIAQETSWTLMKFVNLLKYFQDQDYLYLWQQTPNNQPSRYGQLTVGNAYIEHAVSDSHVAGLLVDYSFRTIIVGQTLIDYVDHDYQTTDQVQHAENLAIAQGSLSEAQTSVKRATQAIMIAIALAFISIIATFYLANQQSNSATKIDTVQMESLSTQFDGIQEAVNEVSNQLENLVLPDTVKTVITKPVKVVK